MPSRFLEGLTTDSGWTVTEQINEKLGSGGTFCVRYLAESPSGEVGFLKAMDLSSVIHDLEKVQQTVNEYLFEQNILLACKDRKLSRVVTPLDTGKIEVPNFSAPGNVVYYVIFEKADGDLRKKHLESTDKNWLGALRALHHVALGIEQLHLAGIAHQDVKPSNILSFTDHNYKISDLGRVVDAAGLSPFSSMYFSGDSTYMPIELYFGRSSQDFQRRKAADMYMVGSLIYHLIEGIHINARLRSEAELLDKAVFHRSYEESTPILLGAFNTILRRFGERCEKIFNERVSRTLQDVVFEMCHPDYTRRGNSRFRNNPEQYSVRRYVTKIANIIRVVEFAGVKNG